MAITKVDLKGIPIPTFSDGYWCRKIIVKDDKNQDKESREKITETNYVSKNSKENIYFRFIVRNLTDNNDIEAKIDIIIPENSNNNETQLTSKITDKNKKFSKLTQIDKNKYIEDLDAEEPDDKVSKIFEAEIIMDREKYDVDPFDLVLRVFISTKTKYQIKENVNEPSTEYLPARKDDFLHVVRMVKL